MESPTRTPLIATVFALNGEIDEKKCRGDGLAYSYLYGLEMQVDDEWPLDLVMTVPHCLIDIATNDINLEEMGIATAGFTGLPRKADGTADFEEMSAVDRNWAIYPFATLEPVEVVSANVKQATERGINILLDSSMLPEESATEIITRYFADLSADAYKHLVPCLPVVNDGEGLMSPATCHQAAAEWRKAVTQVAGADAAESMRILLLDKSGQIDRSVSEWVNRRDVDGIAYVSNEFGLALKAMMQLADDDD